MIRPRAPHIRRLRSRRFDYLIVGAGFAGSVLAERLAAGSGKRVLLIDRRPHVGGNADDHYDDAGILIHRYDPHIFHTNAPHVAQYLSRFTRWRPYEHRVLASVDGMLVPIPTNLTTINRLSRQRHPRISVSYEFPSAEGDPYYPVPRAENAELFRRYQALADATPEVTFVGRLATYRYYNMDQVVAQALATHARIHRTRGRKLKSAGTAAGAAARAAG